MIRFQWWIQEFLKGSFHNLTYKQYLSVRLCFLMYSLRLRPAVAACGCSAVIMYFNRSVSSNVAAACSLLLVF